MIATCTNPDCPEHDVPKDVPDSFPLEAVTCGGCGGPVTPDDQ